METVMYYEMPAEVSEAVEGKNAEVASAILGEQFGNVELRYQCGTCYRQFTSISVLSEHNCLDTGEASASTVAFNLESLPMMSDEQLATAVAANQVNSVVSDGTQVAVVVEDSKVYVTEDKEDPGVSKLYQCDQCLKRYSTQHSLKRHIKCHDPLHASDLAARDPSKLKYACKVCGKRFATPSSCERHVRTHTGERPYTCQFCARTFVQKEHHKRHLLTHTGLKPYRCGVCGKSYARECERVYHLKNKHSLDADLNPITTFPCGVCGVNFSSANNLEQHILTIHEGDKAKCAICGKKMLSVALLTRHLITAHLDRAVKCPKCPKAFHFEKDLRRHIENNCPHTRNSCFKCDECDLYFKKKSTMEEHMKKHAPGYQGALVHECNICNKKFQFANGLNRHIIKHTAEQVVNKVEGERKQTLFRCPACLKSFNQAYMLYSHELRNHPELIKKSPEYAYDDNVYDDDEDVLGSAETSDGSNLEKKKTGKAFNKDDEIQGSPVKCSHCGDTFKSFARLGHHMKKHVLPVVCRTCGERFETSRALGTHRRASHP